MDYETYKLMQRVRDFWKSHKLAKIADAANEWIDDNCYIYDGFGGCWLCWCEDCGAEMYIMRPGDARCADECYRNRL